VADQSWSEVSAMAAALVVSLTLRFIDSGRPEDSRSSDPDDADHHPHLAGGHVRDQARAHET